MSLPADRVSAMRLEQWRQTAATDDAIRRLKAAGASIEDIMRRLGVSRTYATRIAGRRQ